MQCCFSVGIYLINHSSSFLLLTDGHRCVRGIDGIGEQGVGRTCAVQTPVLGTTGLALWILGAGWAYSRAVERPLILS